MSSLDANVDLTPRQGMDLRSLQKDVGPPYLQNIIPRNGELLVRAGFGTVRQFGTSLNAGRTQSLATFGIGPCIGATSLRTVWDAQQILSIHPLYAFTGNTAVNSSGGTISGTRGYVLDGVVAFVHDLTTGRKAEFVLHLQDAGTDDLQMWLPNYATRYQEDHSSWLRPQRQPQWAVFAGLGSGVGMVQQRSIIVAIDGCGLWTYRPIDIPSAPVSRQCDSLNQTTLVPAAGEISAFSPLNLFDGPVANNGVGYARTYDLGSIDAICTVNGDRILYASKNTMWFSVPNNPANVLADNNYVLPTTDSITMVTPVRNGVLVATNRQTWFYQPVLAGNQDSGILTLISDGVGCVNNRAYVNAADGVVFADTKGVYSYSGGLQAIPLSKPIDRLWADPQSLQLPLTDFYTSAGATTLAADQLPARLDVREQMQSARLCWDQAKRTAFCVCDDVTLAWTEDFGWSVWLFQTHAGSSLEVRGMANISMPTMVSVDQDLYLVGGPDEVTYDAGGNQWVDASCYLLQLGRGGAIDRSTCASGAKPDVWYSALGGYVAPGDVVRYSIGATNYDHTVLDDDDFASIYAALAVSAAANPNYDVAVGARGLCAIAKTAAPAAPVVASSVLTGDGTFTTTHAQTYAAASLTDADLEDQRTPIGGWVQLVTHASRPTLYVGEYVKAPAGLSLPWANVTTTEETYWFPVLIGNCGASQPSIIQLDFEFDAVNWRPICVTANPGDPAYGEVAWITPTERLASEIGYRRGFPDATHQVRVYRTGVVTPTGNEIRINFDGAAGVWSSAPGINAGSIGPDPLLWLGFRYIGTATTQWLNPQNIAASVDRQEPGVYFWQSGRYPAEQAAWADKQQPVDWVAKTTEAEGGSGAQIRCRGVLMTAMHLGDGSDDVVPNWQYGPLNTATSTDMRDYAGQALDFSTIPVGNIEQNDIGPFPRMTPAGITTDPVVKTFDNVATWGDSADATKGNLLISDAAVDDLATTDGSQGLRVSVMAHGTMNAPGEGVRLSRVLATIRKMGNLQRWR